MRTGTALRTIAIFLLAAATVGALAGCSSSSSSPTEPTGSAAGGGTAVIGGSVSTSGGAASTARASAAAPAGRAGLDLGRRGATALDGHAPSGGGAAGAPVSVSAADETGAGVTVSIQGTGITTVADAQGNFQLSGVPGGNQVVVFDTGSGAPGLLVEGIQSREVIDLDVTVDGSTVQVNSMSRSGGEGDGEEEVLDPANLFAELAPQEWNLNFEGSSGTVEAFIRGDGFELVDLASIEMVGDDPAAAPLPATSASRQGDHVRARFPMNRVIGLLLDPQPGSVHTVLLTFSAEGDDERFELAVEVTIENDDDDGEDDDGEDDGGEDDGGDDGVVDLTLDIQPDTWNTNWRNANGTVSALIRGDGFEDVDLDSVVLIGTDPAAAPLVPQSISAQGNHVRARFGQSDAFATLLDADTGQTHVIVIRFSVGGEEMELSEEIRTVGPPIDD